MELRETYCDIACNVIGSENTALQCDACPDQRVGSIKDFDGNADTFPIRESATRLDDHPCIVLVMGSPHIN